MTLIRSPMKTRPSRVFENSLDGLATTSVAVRQLGKEVLEHIHPIHAFGRHDLYRPDHPKPLERLRRRERN